MRVQFLTATLFLFTACSNLPDTPPNSEADMPPSPATIVLTDLSLEELAATGDAGAQYTLGENYLWGKGVAMDQPTAANWLLLAAQQGYAPAQFLIGRMYLDGTYYDQDYDAATQWFQKAAKQGMTQAQYFLGARYKW